ncbi:VIR protein [Plasmodium vivax]|uniref:VIR protein n=1 Tax=Plasmodium vivax TaxID=5855 RepID=A0A1G4EAU4_PLAVI|nr:VIR protein [Plasmodium vivax]
MACKKYYNGYPSYICYKDIREQFVDKLKGNDYKITHQVSSFANEYKNGKLQIPNELSAVFTNLKKYLSNNHVFTSHDKYNGKGTCKYISYLLCDGIRKKKGDCDEESFKVFKEFVDSYYERTKSSICNYKLEPLNNDEFKKMKDLYDLYDKIIYLLPFEKYVPDHYCKDLLHLFKLYNNFLHENPSGSVDFNNMLTQFEVLIDTITKNGKIHCTDYSFIISTPHLYEKIEPPIIPPAHTSLGSESNPSQEDTLDSAHNPEIQEVPISSTMSGGEQQRTYTENSQIYHVSDPFEVAETYVSQETADSRQLHQKPEHSEQYEPFRRKENYGPGNNYGQGGYREINETFLPGKDSFVVKEQLVLGSDKENPGFMTNVQSAISGFMKDVDPVPVVGVSGGMGALFLLFRYTPAGAFFRGGRGRVHRIPSGFSGPFPGGYTGYEDLFDGNFANGPINISYRPNLE